MKFTSEDLLHVMGLKVGDMIHNQSRNITYLVCVSDWSKGYYLKDDCNNSKDVWLVDIIGEDYTIIQPKPTLTEDEKVILRNLSKELKFISRDSFQKGGNLNLFKDKPERNWVIIGGDGYWVDNRNHMPYYSLRNFNHLFQFIKWEDEPYSIEELLGDS